MRRIIKLENKPYFLSYAACGGYEERRGPLGESFDLCYFPSALWTLQRDQLGNKTAFTELGTGSLINPLSHSYGAGRGHVLSQPFSHNSG